jgi:hypothetical protein
MIEELYANCLADVRDAVLEHLYRTDPAQYEYWLPQVVGSPELVVLMVRDVLSSNTPPVNDPEMYKRGLFE